LRERERERERFVDWKHLHGVFHTAGCEDEQATLRFTGHVSRLQGQTKLQAGEMC